MVDTKVNGLVYGLKIQENPVKYLVGISMVSGEDVPLNQSKDI